MAYKIDVGVLVVNYMQFNDFRDCFDKLVYNYCSHYYNSTKPLSNNPTQSSAIIIQYQIE